MSHDDDKPQDELTEEERAALADPLSCLAFAEQTGAEMKREKQRHGRRLVILARAFQQILDSKSYLQRDFATFPRWYADHFNDIQEKQLKRYLKVQHTPLRLAEGFTLEQLEAATNKKCRFLLPALLTVAARDFTATQITQIRRDGERRFAQDGDQEAAQALVRGLLNKDKSVRPLRKLEEKPLSAGATRQRRQAAPKVIEERRATDRPAGEFSLRRENSTISNDSDDLSNKHSGESTKTTEAPAQTPCISTPEVAHIVPGAPAPGWSYPDWERLITGLGLAMPAEDADEVTKSLIFVVGSSRVVGGVAIVAAAYARICEACRRDLGPLGPPPHLVERWLREIGSDDTPLRFGAGVCLTLALRPKEWRLYLQLMPHRPLPPVQRAELRRIDALIPRLPPVRDFFVDHYKGRVCPCEQCQAGAAARKARSTTQRSS